MNTFLLLLITVSIIILCIFISRNFYYIGNINKILQDTKKLNHIKSLIPYIYGQIERSAQSIYLQYQIDVKTGKIKQVLTREEYLEFINRIRIHFYGTIPKSMSGDELFKYIDSRQIDIIIINQFKSQNQFNDNFFKISE